jgi:hypothetical protein
MSSWDGEYDPPCLEPVAKKRPAPELVPIGPYPFAEDVITRTADAIAKAGCPGREGPFGGYDYGYNVAFYGPEPEGGRYVVRDFRDPRSDTWGGWVHQTPDRDKHEAALSRLTAEHVAVAALKASGLVALPSVADLARALWIAKGYRADIWDGEGGEGWQAHMVGRRSEYMQSAAELIQILTASPAA